MDKKNRLMTEKKNSECRLGIPEKRREDVKEMTRAQ